MGSADFPQLLLVAGHWLVKAPWFTNVNRCDTSMADSGLDDFALFMQLEQSGIELVN